MAKKTKYETLVEAQMDKIKLWTIRGFTDTELAFSVGVAESTWNLYKKKHPEFQRQILMWKNESDGEVTDSIRKRALGYDYVEEFIEFIPGSDGKPDIIKKIRKFKKHVVADTMAGIYWLNNRQPDKWKNRREKATEEDTQAKYFGDMKEEDIKALCESEREAERRWNASTV